MTAPYDYPAVPLTRRHEPRGYAAAGSYRPWLRDDFSFRCIFCGLRETWYPTPLDVEHFEPVVRVPAGALDYGNLLYACRGCNAKKGSRSVPDPTSELLRGTVTMDGTGTLVATTPAAREVILVLGPIPAGNARFGGMLTEVVQWPNGTIRALPAASGLPGGPARPVAAAAAQWERQTGRRYPFSLRPSRTQRTGDDVLTRPTLNAGGRRASGHGHAGRLSFSLHQLPGGRLSPAAWDRSAVVTPTGASCGRTSRAAEGRPRPPLRRQRRSRGTSTRPVVVNGGRGRRPVDASPSWHGTPVALLSHENGRAPRPSDRLPVAGHGDLPAPRPAARRDPVDARGQVTLRLPHSAFLLHGPSGGLLRQSA